MHKVWLDTNVLLDYLLRRTGFELSAIELIKRVERKEITAFTSVINLVHTHYQLRKITTEPAARDILQSFIKIIHVKDIPSVIAQSALANLAIPDFEDAVQYESALLSEADFLLTRNLTDFTAATGPVVCTVAHYLYHFHEF
jgi:predicted nucleic acid-binding protein